MFDWNDLKYLLAVSREGSTLAAARALGVDQTTVQRRLAELERRLGRPLAKRHPSGYRLTEFGVAMSAQAERVERAVADLERNAGVARDDAVGIVRVTCPEPIVARLTAAGWLDRFHARHPGLRVEFVLADRYLDLAAGDADVALRSGDTDDGKLVGRKVADSLWAIYASRAYVERQGAPAAIRDLEAHAIVGLDGAMAQHRAAVWWQKAAPRARVAARSGTVLGLVSSARAGVGLAALPTALGDAEPDLIRVLGPIDELTRAWRILTTPRLRRTPRVRAFFGFVVEEIGSLRPILTG